MCINVYILGDAVGCRDIRQMMFNDDDDDEVSS